MKLEQIKHIQTKITQPVQITDYIIGSDLLTNLDQIKDLSSKNFSSFLLLSDTTAFKLYGEKVVSSIRKLGKPVVISLVAPGEKYKSLSEISRIVKPYFEVRFDRNACLINLGGGVISDLGGFLASILLRGISYINIPTTLLAQIDASIGGKTGVNYWITDNLMYKNMIGRIEQPSIVISDAETLQTLPQKEIQNGLGEIVKYWIGWGIPSIEQLFMIKKAIKTPELIKTISLCQKIKIDIVRQDPFETKGIREKLNLGHTIGHAVESASAGRLSHGEAVAVGLTVASLISTSIGMLDTDVSDRIINTIDSLGLPIKFQVSQTSMTKSDLIMKVNDALKIDKKGGTFVLIEDIGKLNTGVVVDLQLIQKIISEVIV